LLDIDILHLWSWGCSDIHLETALKISRLQELTIYVYLFLFGYQAEYTPYCI